MARLVMYIQVVGGAGEAVEMAVDKALFKKGGYQGYRIEVICR